MTKRNETEGWGWLLIIALIGISRTAFLRAESRDDFRETAFTICQDLSGQLVRGSEAIGDSITHVNITPSCPTGCKTLGLFHTHPAGIPEASAADIFEMRRLGLKQLCISSGDILRCQEVR